MTEKELLKRKEALAKYLGVNVEDINDDTDIYGKVFENLEDNSEYWVGTYEEVKKSAGEYIEDIIGEQGIDAFPADFQAWIYENAVDFDKLKNDYLTYIRDGVLFLEDNDDLAEVAINDYEVVSREDIYEEDEYGNEVIKDSFDRDKIINAILDKAKENFDNMSVGDILDFFGDDVIEEVIKENPNMLDMSAIVDKAISWYGLAHFVATYDEKEIKLGDTPYYAYRLN